jgi:type II secretory pathway pseudopilin PulG
MQRIGKANEGIMSKNRRSHAFTLVELLVTIGIIVILIGLLLPAVTHIKKAAYGTSTAQQISVLTSAIEQYHSDFNAYPGPLPLNQIDYTDANATNSSGGAAIPSMFDAAGTPHNLVISPTMPTSTAGTFDPKVISGPENLVLGLLGGLKYNATNTTFYYDPTVIYAQSGTNLTSIPAPIGPSSLSLGNSKTTPAYLVVKSGDLSNPFDANAAKVNANFVDEAYRKPNDTIIPVFIDKYPDALPILYMRAQRGAPGLVSFAGYDKPSGTALPPDPATNQPVSSYQYDLREINAYTNSDGTSATSNIGLNYSAKINRHGLQKVWVSASSPPAPISSSAPIDAWVYLRNPDVGPAIPTQASGTGAIDLGVPRQKDGYILISAGPDRVYGTTDDITNFGSVAP